MEIGAMNAYVASVIENVKKKHGNEPELVQTVEEAFASISPVMDKHPEYEKADLLGRMAELERMFTFRVVWMDDKDDYHTNIGYCCQFNGAIGPYKGGLRRLRQRDLGHLQEGPSPGREGRDSVRSRRRVLLHGEGGLPGDHAQLRPQQGEGLRGQVWRGVPSRREALERQG